MKKSKFNFKNVKIIHAIIILGTIALLTNILMGIVAFIQMSKLNDNVDELYSSQLVKVTIAGYINGDMGQLRNALTKVIDRPYNQDNVDVVLKSNEEVQKNIENIYKLELLPREKELLGKLKESYESYFKSSEQIINDRKNGKAIDVAFVERYGKNGSQVSSILTELTNENVKAAEGMYNLSEKEFSRSKTIFFTISLAVLALIIIILTFIIKGINVSIRDFSEILKVVAKGDFTVEIDKTATNEFGEMKKELAITVESISDILKGLKNNTMKINDQVLSLSAISEEMSSSSAQVGEAIQEVAKGSSNQSSELIEITNVVNVFANSIDNTILVIEDVTKNANNVNDMAGGSGSKLNELMDSLEEIQKSFKSVSDKVNSLGISINKINEITSLINNIADQTNLLALNAAIEAARAGEAGKGFAVVAEEIRKLAEQSKSSSQEITDIVNVVSSESKEVMENTRNVSESFKQQESIVIESITSFKQIIKEINDVIPLINNVNNLMETLDKEKEKIMSKVENASAVAEENASASEEIAASADEMNASAEEVATSATMLSTVFQETLEDVDKFKLNN